MWQGINQKIQHINHEGERVKIQEIIVGAEGDEVVNAFDESSLKNWPLAAEEGDDHQQRRQAVAHQQPLDRHFPTEKSKKLTSFLL